MLLPLTTTRTRALLFALLRGLAVDLEKVIRNLEHRIDERVNDRARHEGGACLG